MKKTKKSRKQNLSYNELLENLRMKVQAETDRRYRELNKYCEKMRSQGVSDEDISNFYDFESMGIGMSHDIRLENAIRELNYAPFKI